MTSCLVVASKGLLKNLPHKLFMTDATSDMSVRGVAIPTLQQLSVYVPPAAINGLSKSVRMCVWGGKKNNSHTQVRMPRQVNGKAAFTKANICHVRTSYTVVLICLEPHG